LILAYILAISFPKPHIWWNEVITTFSFRWLSPSSLFSKEYSTLPILSFLSLYFSRSARTFQPVSSIWSQFFSMIGLNTSVRPPIRPLIRSVVVCFP
jgi:hypothetical protein